MWSNIKYDNFDVIIDDGLHTLKAGFNFSKIFLKN